MQGNEGNKSRLLLAIAIASLLVWTACGSSPSFAPTSRASSLVPGASLSVSSLSFENQAAGASSPGQTITFLNNGTGVLNIQSLAVAGDFAQTNNCGQSLAAGLRCTFNVTFVPKTPGDFTGTLTVTDNAPGSPHKVLLSGSTNLVVSVKPQTSSLTFTQTLQFSTMVTNGISGAVEWDVDGISGGNSTVGAISLTGLYTPPQAAGTHTVRATSTEQPSANSSAQVVVTNLAGVFTQHNDNGRTGQNLQEIVLMPANVNSNQFGKLFSLLVDGYVYGQPLYMENLKFPDGSYHNTLFVVTEHDSVYAFDADGNSTTPLWRTSFISPPAVTTVLPTDTNCGNLTPEIGITSTPVIDPASNTIYVVALTKELSDPACTSNCSYNYIHRLHALDITTGAEKFGGPVAITATVPGTGSGSDGNGNLAFDSFYHLQRPGLLLVNGVVYIGFSSNCDILPFHGWLLAYNATTLQQVAVFNTTPNGGYGGIWQGGGGIVADSTGNIYIAIGNGTFDIDSGGVDYGDSVLKMQLQGNKLAVTDYFTPYNQAPLDAGDVDLGSGTPVLLPDQSGAIPHLVTIAGKEGRLYLLNRDSLGGFDADHDAIVQSIPGAFPYYTFGTAACWNGQVYYTGEADYPKAFTLSSGLFSTPPLSAPDQFGYGYRGSPSVSANGSTNGIVWILNNSQAFESEPTILDAYDANSISTKLYGSDQAPGSRDQAGAAVKFAMPTIVNGKVYVPTQTEITVYGLLPN